MRHEHATRSEADGRWRLPPATTTSAEVPARGRSPLRALCVSDDPDHAELVRFALEQLPGFTVRFECALLHLNPLIIPVVSPVDVVFVDVGPRLVTSPRLALPTEEALVRSIREAGYGGRLVVLTVENDDSTVASLEAAGADVCLRRRELRSEKLEELFRDERARAAVAPDRFACTTPAEAEDPVASFAVRAAQSRDPHTLLADACATLAIALRVELVAAFELHSSRDVLVRVAGVGWKQNGHALAEIAVAETGAPARERLAEAEDIASGFSAAIVVDGRRWGVLGVFDRALRPFSAHDVRIVETVARLVAAVLWRELAEHRPWQTADKIIAKIVHQVRQPLQTIGLELALVRADRTETRLKSALDKIEGEVVRCDSILQRALRLAGGEPAPASASAPAHPTLPATGAGALPPASTSD